ncbi:MAG: ABC transporter ATP-binding protein [Clostridiales bacterium]|nr:ABC transporter ATP-binding protein [Clostridiales bacterium]
MATIELKNIWHSYDSKIKKGSNPEYVIEDLNITYDDGSAIALLGPSGCGKTTLLKIISGILTPTKGKVLFDGKDVTGISARDRHLAQVFQFPVVYDSMNVYGNIAFPLTNDGVDSEKIRERVYEVAEILEITNLLKLPVSKLTPADKQKVSLGRGIVRPNTAAVLLDEPLTVIDPKAQWGLRRKLKQIQRELNFTMIYVTHDQHEALTFAEHVTVMQEGKIDQHGSPEELHEDPESSFVGYFIGSPGMNLIDSKVKENGAVEFEGASVKISDKKNQEFLKNREDVTIGIRPEYVSMSMSEEKKWISGLVKLVEENGAYKIITTTVGSIDIKSRAPESMEIKENDAVWLFFPEDKLKFFRNGKRVK